MTIYQLFIKGVFILIMIGNMISLRGQPVISIPEEQMRIDLEGSRVIKVENGWDIDLRMAPDNNVHPELVFRRWWYCNIDNLNPDTGEILNIRITNAGYSDITLPVWSLDGGPFERVPEISLPQVSGSGPYTHTFTLIPPPGVSTIRLAKYFPYNVEDKDRFIETIRGDSRTRVIVTGHSYENRPIHRIDITDYAVEDTFKRRVWIHAMVHPGETPPPYVIEGLVEFLLSSDPRAHILLENFIFNIVPMVNPDGVAAGNYRVNTRITEKNPYGANLEEEWAEPWDSDEPEVAAIRKDIEKFMGSLEKPGSQPIEILLNVHAAHLRKYPFHFLHEPAWSEPGDYGVNQAVHDLGLKWIDYFRQRSRFVSLGRTSKSTLGGEARPYVEGMMFDRWSRHEKWTGPPNYQNPVMAITYETTYAKGPDRKTWNTPDDYRQNGKKMALAIGDFFNIWDCENNK